MFISDDGKHCLDKEDLCFNCRYRSNDCPLMQALASGIVGLDQEIYIDGCKFYKPKLQRIK